jgi:hypothetical protein
MNVLAAVRLGKLEVPEVVFSAVAEKSREERLERKTVQLRREDR